MQQLLNALGADIKPYGKKWIAKCPVHMDKDFAMIVSQREDGSVGAHCFSCGANGLDLYKHFGLPMSELMGEREVSTGEKHYLPQDIRDQYEIDMWCILIAISGQINGESPSYKDKRRLKLAVARVNGIRDKYSVPKWPFR